uniref:heparan sulfate glucosamine 3-O-sulfotransferase 1-like isoform X1 n=1 Tax=Styela clava TaxID=7725 RepID=UPI00193A2708|nr:heparan sulfate glucosamine 3-O-sulfotransferase 1-like isoform X1 [Styela clava]
MASSFVQRLRTFGFYVVSSKKRIDFNRRMWIAALVFVAFILLLIMYGNYIMNQPERGTIYEENEWVEYEIKQDFKKTSKERHRDKLLVEYEAAKRALSKVFQKPPVQRAPDVIGIGVEKCGTGALRSLLRMHPMIKVAPKEPHFFEQPNLYKLGLKAYTRMLAKVLPHEISFEKTPAYFNWGLATPEHLRDLVPHAKLLLVLCNPTERTYSDYAQEIMMGHLNKNTTFEQMVDDLLVYSADLTAKMNESGTEMEYIEQLFKKRSTNHVLTTGLYYYHLLRWYKVFNMSDIHIVDGEELISNPAKVIKEVQDFLHIPEFVLPENIPKGPCGFSCFAKPLVVERNGVLVAGTARIYCMTGKGRTRKGAWGVANPEYLEKLRLFFAPFNEKLYKLLGRRFNW